MGAQVKYLSPTQVLIDTAGVRQGTSPYELLRKMRGSSYLLGAELGRFGKTRIAWPGGCDFGGSRPLDQHIKGYRALGAKTDTEGGYIYAEADEGLKGSSVYFDVASVGATVNVMLAAVKAEGVTVIDNAAKEPHIVDLCMRITHSNERFYVPYFTGLIYSGTVLWGDGTESEYAENIYHGYQDAGDVCVELSFKASDEEHVVTLGNMTGIKEIDLSGM
jgi:hypothetical protein